MPDSAPRILVIINPVSGQGDIDVALETISRHLDHSGFPYEIRMTRQEGDALKWAREAEGFDRIVAAGGDGTIMEAMSGTVENPIDIPLAQIPLGTANLLARALAIPLETGPAMELALRKGVAADMDVGFLPGHRRYFALVAGAGWDAEMIRDADREMKNRLGFFAYVITGIKHFFDLERSHLSVTIDGRRRRFYAHTLMVINVGEIHGSGIAIGKNVTPHDGKLNLAIVAMRSPMGILRLLFRLLTRKFDGSSELRYFSAEHLEIDATPPLKLEIDGEAIGETPFEVKVVPSGALLVVPAEYATSKQISFRPLASFTSP